jgi:drug/metabolite transporter (DMT)-like permease
VGPFFCLASAVGFGLMAVFAKLAYQQGVAVDGLLVSRFAIAALVLLTIAAITGSLRRMDRRTVVVGLGMGAFGYAAQAGLYLGAVSRMEASQVALVFGVYPVLVMVAAIVIGRERGSVRRFVALATAVAGIVFVLGDVGPGSFDALGAVLSLGSALVYTGYILVGDRVVGDSPRIPLTAMICVGAAISCTAGSIVTGGPRLDITLVGWGWLGAIALVSTVGAVVLFFAGLRRVGPTVASLLSTLEPVVTVVSAALVFHESLGDAQLLGGALVLLAVLVVQWPSRRAQDPSAAAAEPDGTEPVAVVLATTTR